MTVKELQGLKEGQKLSVSYKGIRPCTFKNLKGKCAFVVFDNGDGTGVRLHRVLATTLIMPKKAEPKATPKKDAADLSDLDLLKALADRMGYAIIAK
jgi:hypothetical protein